MYNFGQVHLMQLHKILQGIYDLAENIKSFVQV